MTWKELLALVAATGLISAAWTTLWTWVAHYWTERRQAHHTVVQVVLALEAYAVLCFDVAYSAPEHFRQTSAPYLRDIPDMKGLPAIEHWQSVPPALTDEILSLTNEINISRIKASYAEFHEGNPFESDGYAISFGRRAWALAKRLRASYRLPENRTLEAEMKELVVDKA